MTHRLLALCSALVAPLLLSNCASNNDFGDAKVHRPGGQVDGARYYKVRTTAYHHNEADHIRYGNNNALGGDLKFGLVRSAAADWSVFPVGTVFRIKGSPELFTVDDYGSALVGTKTVDIYKPNAQMMRDWGVRNVFIEVVKQGDYKKSLQILSGRMKHAHVRAMVRNIERKTGLKAG